jgi:hypothetical protein
MYLLSHFDAEHKNNYTGPNEGNLAAVDVPLGVPDATTRDPSPDLPLSTIDEDPMEFQGAGAWCASVDALDVARAFPSSSHEREVVVETVDEASDDETEILTEVSADERELTDEEASDKERDPMVESARDPDMFYPSTTLQDMCTEVSNLLCPDSDLRRFMTKENEPCKWVSCLVQRGSAVSSNSDGSWSCFLTSLALWIVSILLGKKMDQSNDDSGPTMLNGPKTTTPEMPDLDAIMVPTPFWWKQQVKLLMFWIITTCLDPDSHHQVCLVVNVVAWISWPGVVAKSKAEVVFLHLCSYLFCAWL